MDQIKSQISSVPSSLPMPGDFLGPSSLFGFALDILSNAAKTHHLFFPSALQALMKRNTDLTPSQTEQTAITNLVNKIQAVLDGLIVSPGNFDACVSLSSQNSTQ